MLQQGTAHAPKPIQGIGGEQAAPGKVSFGEMLQSQFSEVETQGIAAEDAIKRSLMGNEVNPHSTVIAVQKATTSLTLLMTIKDRLERAYQEIIRTPLG